MLKDTALPPPDHPYPTVRKYDWEERHKGWPLTSVAEHANVFAIALAMIWSFTLNGKTTLVIALLNWIFAFISDDFLIAASYRRKLGVTPPSFDAWRINLGSLGLVVLMVVASTMEYPRWATWAMVSVILVFRIIAPNFHRIRETGAETMELWGVYVGDELYILNSELLRRAVIDRDSEITRRIRAAHEAGVEVEELSAISGYSADRVTEIVQSAKEDC
ncbi:hypothetical protein ACNO8X_14650 [Mycobacterium sp. PDNC021]|uniref:hypothetical protein n=1 Tax=Mycobacterium sp. PDNC021 TaxID=3391399 RepID=UPI003AAD7594